MLIAATALVILASVVGLGWLFIDVAYRVLEGVYPKGRRWGPVYVVVGFFAYMGGVMLALFVWTCLFVAAGIVE